MRIGNISGSVPYNVELPKLLTDHWRCRLRHHRDVPLAVVAEADRKLDSAIPVMKAAENGL
jgi:hypothetical protein